MAYLKFPLFLGRYVNRWLVSGIMTPVHFTPVTLHGDINLWLKRDFPFMKIPARQNSYARAGHAPPRCPCMRAGARRPRWRRRVAPDVCRVLALRRHQP